MAKLSFVPAQERRAGRISLGGVRDETITDLEEAWASIQQNPAQHIRSVFDGRADRRRFFKEARTYLEHRVPPLRIRVVDHSYDDSGEQDDGTNIAYFKLVSVDDE